MPQVAVIYATREGHTRVVAEHAAVDLRAAGFRVDVHALTAGATAPDLSPYEVVLLAASVHEGRHEPELVAYVRTHLDELRARHSAFLSVGLSEAVAEDASAKAPQRERARREVRDALGRFFMETRWFPEHVLPVAGVLAYTRYGVVKRFLMKLIAWTDGMTTDTSRDYEFTNWALLDRFLGRVASRLRAPLRIRPHVRSGPSALN